MQNTFKRKLFDRYDGWRVRNVDAVFSVIPFFLRTRLDSQNLLAQDIYVDQIEEFIKEHKEDIPNLTIMHVIIAAFVRVISQRPYLNRFVIWNKIYARNSISVSIAVKRSITDDGEETLIKPEFEPTDTLYDVVKAVNKEIEGLSQQNDSDKIAKAFGRIPSFIIRFVVSILRWLDNVGKLPKAIHEASPWHTSMFLTNIGSLRMDPIYHHLYEFGTCTLFTAMGRRKLVPEYFKDGTVKVRKGMGLKFVIDERVCDGHYYAVAVRMLNKYLSNPALLLEPPKEVFVDDGVGRPRMDI